MFTTSVELWKNSSIGNADIQDIIRLVTRFAICESTRNPALRILHGWAGLEGLIGQEAQARLKYLENVTGISTTVAPASTVSSRTKSGELRVRNTEPATSEKRQGKDGRKIGPNDPCHCDSGKKFKRCHSKKNK